MIYVLTANTHYDERLGLLIEPEPLPLLTV